jgi:hypothetical protein
MPFGVFNGKNTRHAAEFFFKLYRLRRGRAYDQASDKISTGPEDFEQLLLWNLPTSIAEPANSFTENALVADSIIGATNNEVSVRLPFNYKRGGTEWSLAHNISKAFLQNYTIGYHEFVADFSAADEPVFLSAYKPAEIQTLVISLSSYSSVEEKAIQSVTISISNNNSPEN